MLVWKLLRSHISWLQLCGFFAANLVGTAIILTAVQLWRDVRPAIEAPDSVMANDYLVLAGGEGFDRESLEGLRGIVEDVGVFEAARYSIVGGISVMGAGFETQLFFESVPDRFLDVENERWFWDENSREIPIVLPRNYLNLYNFGFAATRGLPRVSEAVVSSVPMRIVIDGMHEFEGRVVAFSNRLNTILVPESFIEWSNSRYARGSAGVPSRVIVEVENVADEGLQSYLRTRGYSVEGGNPAAGRTNYLLRAATVVVGGVGVLIALLSVFILMLSVFLLLQKNTRKLEDLLLLGYSRAQVSRPYIVLSSGLNLLVLIFVVPVILWARCHYKPFVSMLGEGFEAVSLWPTLLCGFGIALVVSAANALAIRRKISRLT